MKYMLVESWRRIIQIIIGAEIFEFPVLNLIRTFFMRISFGIGRKPVIGARVRFTRQHKMVNGSLVIGDNVTIANNCSIDYSGKVTIENNVTLSMGTVILSHKHDPVAMAHGDHKTAIPSSIMIKKGAWIGTNALLLPGVTVGEYSVVGAGAVVTKDVEPYTLVGGNPAHFIKRIELN